MIATCLTNQALVQEKPVVCQVCHYTPALDLAQLGPLAGPEGTIPNGRNQVAHQSNSRVMHNHHGQFTDLFPPLDPPVQDGNGGISNQATRLAQIEDSCYQCHPGTNVQCLRGAMFDGGMLCNDCHGDMQQVGADFTARCFAAEPGRLQAGSRQLTTIRRTPTSHVCRGPTSRVAAPVIPGITATTWRVVRT